MCNYYDKHSQEIGQLYKNFSEQRLCLLKNRERKITFIECLVSVIVLSTFSCGFSQLFRCLWSHYHRGLSSLLPECLFYFLLISAIVFLLYLPVCRSLILFSSICPSFWYCFWCAKFHTATCFCMIFCTTVCHYDSLIMYFPIIGCCLFLGTVLGGTCWALSVII